MTRFARRVGTTLWLSCIVGCAQPAFAEEPTTWLTIQGNPDIAAVDTVEVDPVPVLIKGELRTMRVRVSRALTRTNRDGITYRSFEGNVLFDCEHDLTRYTFIIYYLQPGWKGISHAVVNYPRDRLRPMELRDINPNPAAKILRAVCKRSATSSR